MKTKTLVGRIFTITNHKNIPLSGNSYLETTRLQKSIGYLNKEKIGEAVMVYDETARKVKIGIKSGQLVWISKHYLKQDTEQVIKSPVGEMQTLIDELVRISNGTDSNTSKELSNLLVKARSILSFIENSN